MSQGRRQGQAMRGRSSPRVTIGLVEALLIFRRLRGPAPLHAKEAPIPSTAEEWLFAPGNLSRGANRRRLHPGSSQLRGQALRSRWTGRPGAHRAERIPAWERGGCAQAQLPLLFGGSYFPSRLMRCRVTLEPWATAARATREREHGKAFGQNDYPCRVWRVNRGRLSPPGEAEPHS